MTVPHTEYLEPMIERGTNSSTRSSAPWLSVYLWWGHFGVPPRRSRGPITRQVGLSGTWRGRAWWLLWVPAPRGRDGV